jgi:hypothetical protein
MVFSLLLAEKVDGLITEVVATSISSVLYGKFANMVFLVPDLLLARDVAEWTDPLLNEEIIELSR